jgi:hypothetical protein
MKKASVKKGRGSRLHTHRHSVKFYGNDASLFTTVAGFLCEGLVVGQPAIVIATPSHRAAILQHLQDRLIDVERARESGDLLMLDAEETLTTFMSGDEPDGDLFESNVGSLIDGALDGREPTMVRAYGEMVDVLWKAGRPEAAIKLEMLWNRLAAKHGFALLCGYAMGNFYKQAEQFQLVCEQHTQIVESDANVVTFTRRRATKTA